MQKEFFYISCDKKTKIHAVEWKPQGKVKAVLQICHGMAEYIERYAQFAEWLSQQGYYVVGNDHLGHGGSIHAEEDCGYFHKEKGNEYVIGDIRKLFLITRKQYHDVPYFMMGHSMGSFLLRQYLQTYGAGLSGAIIMGTGYNPQWMLYSGMVVCKILAFFKEERYRSRFVDKMVTGRLNKRFEPGETGKEWLSVNRDNVRRYTSDSKCGFVFTLNAYYHMFRGMKELTVKNMKEIPPELPVFFVSGKEDAVGDFGRGVRKVFAQYKKVGMKNLSIRLYSGLRHEILNETGRIEVFEDLRNWMEKNIKK